MKSYRAGISLLAFTLLACAQATTGQPGGSEPRPGHSDAVVGTAATPVRVIVQFKPTIESPGATLLQSLRRQTRAQVHYVTSVSGDTHVFQFLPAPGQSEAQLLQQLRTMPGIVGVEIDAKVHLP